jgi:hypothetical protein
MLAAESSHDDTRFFTARTCTYAQNRFFLVDWPAMT